MSHRRRNPSRPTKTLAKKKQKKRMVIGLMIIAVFLLSIIISTVFVTLSTP